MMRSLATHPAYLRLRALLMGHSPEQLDRLAKHLETDTAKTGQEPKKGPLRFPFFDRPTQTR